MTDGMYNFAAAIRALTWAEMVKISEAIVSEVPHLIKSEKLDRDGMAAALSDMAVDIGSMDRQDSAKASPDESTDDR